MNDRLCGLFFPEDSKVCRRLLKKDVRRATLETVNQCLSMYLFFYLDLGDKDFVFKLSY